MRKEKKIYDSTSIKKGKFVYDIIIIAIALFLVLLLILGSDFVGIKNILNFDIKDLTFLIGILFFLFFPIRVLIFLFNFKSKSMVSETFKVIGITCCIIFFLYVLWWALLGMVFYFKY